MAKTFYTFNNMNWGLEQKKLCLHRMLVHEHGLEGVINYAN